MERRRVKLLVGLSVAAFLLGLGYVSLDEAVTPYRAPGELSGVGPGEEVQVIGTVSNFSQSPAGASFVVSGDGGSVEVRFDGDLPPMFSTGGEVVARGVLTTDGRLEASDVISKCPSRYEEGS